MKILVTGTPGVGKTTLSGMLAEAHGIEHIDITKYIRANRIYESYDRRLDSLVFDEDTVARHLDEYVRSMHSFIIDTHSPAVATGIMFDYVFHVVCDTSILADRLEARGYSKYKVEKNLECEIFDVIGEEVEELDARVLRVNGSFAPVDSVDLDFEGVLKMVGNSIK